MTLLIVFIVSIQKEISLIYLVLIMNSIVKKFAFLLLKNF